MKLRLALPLLCAVVCSSAPLRAADADKAQKLIDRAIKAIGGPAALKKSRNVIVEDEGVFYGMGDGLPFQGRYVHSYGKSIRTKMEIVGQFTTVTDGDSGWMDLMGMVLPIDGDALDIAKQGNLVNYALTLIPLQKPNKAFKLSLAKAETVDGEKCEGVHINHKNMPQVTVFFSAKTGLPKKTRFKTKAAELGFQEVTEESVMNKYKKIDGVMTSVDVTLFRDGKKFVESKPSKVTYPDSIDEKEFKKP